MSYFRLQVRTQWHREPLDFLFEVLDEVLPARDTAGFLRPGSTEEVVEAAIAGPHDGHEVVLVLGLFHALAFPEQQEKAEFVFAERLFAPGRNVGPGVTRDLEIALDQLGVRMLDEADGEIRPVRISLQLHPDEPRTGQHREKRPQVSLPIVHFPVRVVDRKRGIQVAILDDLHRSPARVLDPDDFFAVPVTVAADAERVTDFQDVHSPVGRFVIGVITVQADVLENHRVGLLAEDIETVAPVEVNTVADAVGLDSRTLVTDVLGMIRVLRRLPNFIDVDELPALVDLAVPFAALFHGHFGLRALVAARPGTFPRQYPELPACRRIVVGNEQQRIVVTVTVGVDQF